MTVAARVTFTCDVCESVTASVYGGSGQEPSFVESRTKRAAFDPNMRLPDRLPSGWRLIADPSRRGATLECPRCSG